MVCHVYRYIAIFTISILVGACKTNQPVNGTAVDDMNMHLYQALDTDRRIDKGRAFQVSRISNELIPKAHYHRGTSGIGSRRFDIAVKSVPAKTFFMGLVKDSNINIAVSPDVEGMITLNLKNVTIAEVLQTLEDVYGYSYRTTSSGYQILANKIKTKIYSVNYLDIDRKGESNLNISSGQVSQGAANGNNNAGGGNLAGGVGNLGGAGGAGGNNNRQQITSSIGQVHTKSTIDFWKQLQETLEGMVGKENGRSVTVNPVAGVVVARAMPVELKQVEAYLDAVQLNMDRQVVLEAKILEVELNHSYQMGIDWKIFGANLNSINQFTGNQYTQQNFPDAYKINVKWNPSNFTTTIQALSEQGNVQVLSSPRVSTLNNQKAVIKVGNDEFYVTNVSTTNTQVGTTVTPTQDVQLTPFFSGISLDVTPQIGPRGNITLHIHPAVSKVVDHQKEIDLGNSGTLRLPLARSTIRESDTVVHAKDGQVIVIGGLMQNQTGESLAGLPFFANVPFFGTLLRNTRQGSTKSELVILLKPTVVKRKVWSQQLNHAQQGIDGVKRGFHVGGYPGVFGTEGERPEQLGAVSGRYGRPKGRGHK